MLDEGSREGAGWAGQRAGWRGRADGSGICERAAMRFDRDNVRIGRCRKECGCCPPPPPPHPPPTGFMPNTACVPPLPHIADAPRDANAYLYSAQTTSRKTLAVKHLDGEPLTRADLQHDLLNYIFSNKQAVFTDPYRTIHGDPPRTLVTFRDLYINCLLHSPRCSKAFREKIMDSPDFGDEFAKMSLLSNVGRINTTMACKLPAFWLGAPTCL